MCADVPPEGSVLSDVLPMVTPWIQERRSRGDRPEDVLALLGIVLDQPTRLLEDSAEEMTNDDEAMWLQVSLLAAEQRLLFQPRKRKRSLPTHIKDAQLFIRSILEGAHRVLVITGADASVSSGFPCMPQSAASFDSRARDPVADTAMPSAGTNMFVSVAQRHGLFDPADMFDMHQFISDPTPIYDLVREFIKADFKPTAAHAFVSELERQGHLLHTYTINIDGLHSLAGSKCVTNVYGSFGSAVCASCREPSPIMDMMHNKDEFRCSNCSHEHNLIRPDLVFAGDPPISDLEDALRRDLPQTDLLLIIGPPPTCGPLATVAASLARDVPQIYVGQLPSTTKHEFDVELIGSVDDAVRWLAHLLDWQTPWQMHDTLPELKEGAASSTAKRLDGIDNSGSRMHVVPPCTIYFGGGDQDACDAATHTSGRKVDEELGGCLKQSSTEGGWSNRKSSARERGLRIQTPLALLEMDDGRRRRSG